MTSFVVGGGDGGGGGVRLITTHPTWPWRINFGVLRGPMKGGKGTGKAMGGTGMCRRRTQIACSLGETRPSAHPPPPNLGVFASLIKLTRPHGEFGGSIGSGTNGERPVRGGGNPTVGSVHSRGGGVTCSAPDRSLTPTHTARHGILTSTPQTRGLGTPSYIGLPLDPLSRDAHTHTRDTRDTRGRDLVARFRRFGFLFVLLEHARRS